MQKIRHKYIPVVFCFIIFIRFSISAQENNYFPAAMEKMKMNWMWHKTTNPAGQKLDQFKHYGMLSGSYTNTNGNFHRVMEGDKKRSLSLKTEGGANVGDFYFWGKFNYRRNAVKDVKFNASLIDPYRGMPYFVADTNISNWNNQYFDLAFKINFPKLGDKLSFGIGGEYSTYMGAKQRDIRTENYYMKLILRPGIIYSITENNHLGFNFEYYALKEESNMKNVNLYIDQPFYMLHGLGTATINIGSGRTTNYVGNSIGGGVQYQYSGTIDIIFASNFARKVEDAEVSFTAPRKDGSVIDDAWHHKIFLKTKGRANTHYLEMEYWQRNIKGIEYITKYDDTNSFKGYVTLHKNIRSTYADKFLGAGYYRSVNHGQEYKYLLGARVNYAALNNIYILPESKKDAKNLSFELLGKRNFTFSEKLSKKLLLSTNFIYGKNLSGNYVYGGGFKEYPIHSQLEKRDSEYDNSDYFTTRVSGIYSQKISGSSGINLFIGGDFIYSKSKNNSFGNRRNLSFSIGCNF